MRLFSWLRERIGAKDMASSLRQRRSKSPPTPRARLRLEALEDRWVPSTLTVTSNLDSGAGSLRADIAAAHNGDTIVFAPSLVGKTITLTSGELLIKKSLTIAGPGTGELTVSGNNMSRVFELSSKTKPQVTVSGLTVSNGQVYVSGTTHELLAGSSVAFEDRGEHDLKGITGARRVYAVLGTPS